MHLDVVALRDFYYQAALGALVQRRLRARIESFWPRVNGMSVAGFGFAAPFMRPFKREAGRLMVLMPAQQGVVLWPREGPNMSTLVEPLCWPVATSFLDRLLLTHALENADAPHRLLDECWRVLAPEGRLLVIVPNRAGMWARRDGTPFGFGRPYTFEQLENQLAQHGFFVERRAGGLYLPPSTSPFWLRVGPLIERLGRRLDAQRFAGVLIVEAIKRVRAPRSGMREPATAPLPVFGGVAAPAPPAARREQTHTPAHRAAAWRRVAAAQCQGVALDEYMTA